MTEYVVDEVDGVFVLPIQGFVCREVRRGLLIAGPDGSDDETELPVPGQEMSQRLVARRARIERATVSGESTLRVEFDGGAYFEIPADGDVEAWEVRGPGPINVIASVGGGEPHIFDATSKIFTIRAGDALPPELAEMIESFGMPMPGEQPKGADE